MMLCLKNKDIVDLTAVRRQRDLGQGPLILAVGDVTSWRMSGRSLPQSPKIALSDFHEVNADLLDHMRPDYVLSPAISARFDCLDLAAVLHEAGFKGMFRALTGQLPAPDMIRREVASCYPGLDFGFLDGQHLATIVSA